MRPSQLDAPFGQVHPDRPLDVDAERPLELPRATVIASEPVEIQAHGGAEVVQQHAAACLP